MSGREHRDVEQEGWERSDFPIVCETCLGPNPYVRMQRIEYGGTCHISGRPYTVFRWRPGGSDARFKKTIICQDVAKAKNVCQVCLFDLDYNLPVQVRDEALGMADNALPESVAGKEFALTQMAETGQLDRTKFNIANAGHDLLNRIAKTEPNYSRNRAKICTFYLRGECKRGDECPYRHEQPDPSHTQTNYLQGIRDRYYGANDPVANKILQQVAERKKDLTPPDDPTITTLWVGNISPEMTEDDIKSAFYQFGELKSIKKVDSRNCAFVTYLSRDCAERAAAQLAHSLVINGQPCKLLWGKPKKVTSDKGAVEESLPPPPAPGQLSHEDAVAHYPSMDTGAAGSAPKRQHTTSSATTDGPREQAKTKKPKVDA